MGDGYPTVPENRLAQGGWAERVRTESTVFQTPTSRIVGRTVLYDDQALRDTLDSAGFDDLLAGRAESSGRRLVETGESGGYWRFFFATALSFRPPLAPGIGPASMLPTVVTEARRSFTDDLEARGVSGRRAWPKPASPDRRGRARTTGEGDRLVPARRRRGGPTRYRGVGRSLARRRLPYRRRRLPRGWARRTALGRPRRRAPGDGPEQLPV